MNKSIFIAALIAALVIGYAIGWGSMRGELKLKERELANQSNGESGKSRYASSTNSTRRSIFTRSTRLDPVPEAPAPAAASDDANRQRRGPTDAERAAFTARMQEQTANMRSNFFANANLSPEQQQNFVNMFSAMNDMLKDRAAFWADELKAGRITRGEVEVRSRAEMATALVRSYAGLDRSMPPNWRQAAGEDFNVMRFIDPTVFDAYRALRGSRGGFGGPGGGGPPPGGPGGGGNRGN